MVGHTCSFWPQSHPVEVFKLLDNPDPMYFHLGARVFDFANTPKPYGCTNAQGDMLSARKLLMSFLAIIMIVLRTISVVIPYITSVPPGAAKPLAMDIGTLLHLGTILQLKRKLWDLNLFLNANKPGPILWCSNLLILAKINGLLFFKDLLGDLDCIMLLLV